MFSSQSGVIEQMNKTVVVSLVTDVGDRAIEFQELAQKLVGTSTVPIYLLMDPFTEKILGRWNHTQATASGFEDGLAKGIRRFERYQRRRGGTSSTAAAAGS